SPDARIEVIDHILLGRDGDAVAGGGPEAPVFERRQNLRVNRRTHALDYGLADDGSALIDHNLNHYISFCNSTEVVGIDARLGGDSWQRRTNLLVRGSSLGERSIGRTGGGCRSGCGRLLGSLAFHLGGAE